MSVAIELSPLTNVIDADDHPPLRSLLDLSWTLVGPFRIRTATTKRRLLPRCCTSPGAKRSKPLGLRGENGSSSLRVGLQLCGAGVIVAVHDRSLSNRSVLHLYIAWTRRVGFSLTRQALRASSAKRVRLQTKGHRPSHPPKDGTEHAGFSPTRRLAGRGRGKGLAKLSW